MRTRFINNVKNSSFFTVFFIIISIFYPLLNTLEANAAAGSIEVLDAVYMNEDLELPAPGHNLTGWSDADIPGNYGGYGSNPDMHYRQVVERPCIQEGRTAIVTFYIGNNLGKSITIHHLDGLADDSFDVYFIHEEGEETLLGSYTDQESTETWKTSSMNFPSNLSGSITLIFSATGEFFSACNTYGQVAVSWIELWGENVAPQSTKWLAPTAPAFFTRLGSFPTTPPPLQTWVYADMYFEENPDTDIDYYEYQTRNCNLDGGNPNFVAALNMNTYQHGVTCDNGICHWKPHFNYNRRNIHRFRAVDTSGNKGDWSNWNNLTDAEFENISPNNFTYKNYINGTGAFTSEYGYIKENGGFAVREQIRPSAEITSTDPLIPYGGITNSQTITLHYTASDADTGIKQVDAMMAENDHGFYINYSSVGTEMYPNYEQSVTGSIDVTLPENGTYCLYIQAEDIADDLALDQLTGNISVPEGENGNCEFKVTYIETIEITVDRQRTTDHTPPLSGKVSDPNVSVKVAINGGLRNIERKYYDAVNNKDGTWSLPDNTLHELTDGVYDIVAIATDSEGIEYEDKTEDELIIYTQKEEPVPEDRDSEESEDNEDDDSSQNNPADQGLGSVQGAVNDRDEEKEEEEKEISEEVTEVLGESTCEYPSKISGYVYYDINENGKKEEEEKGAGYIDIEITINGETVATARTDENGYWEAEVCPGSYKVRIGSNIPERSELIDSDENEIEVEENKGTGDINFRLKETKSFIENFNFLWCLIPLVLLVLAVLISQLTSKKDK